MPIGHSRAERFALKLHSTCSKALPRYPTHGHVSAVFGPRSNGSFDFVIHSGERRSREARVRVHRDLEVQIESDKGFPGELLECVVHHAEMRER